MGAFPLAAGSVRNRNAGRGAGWRSAISSVQICWLLRIWVVGTAEFELEPAVGFGGNDHLSEEAFVVLLREVLAEMAVPEPAFLPVQGRVHGAASDGEQVVDFVEPEEIVEILRADEPAGGLHLFELFLGAEQLLFGTAGARAFGEDALEGHFEFLPADGAFGIEGRVDALVDTLDLGFVRFGGGGEGGAVVRGHASGMDAAGDGHVQAAALVVLPALAASFLLSKPMAAYQMGEEYARSVGVNVKPFSAALVLLSSLLAACVTAFAGPISFVGIAVPHLVKQLLGSAKPLHVLPGCCLGGAAFCLFCDLLARSLFAPTELSISSVTAVFGAPVVIWLLVRRNSEREGA